jgi:hypothetical protein
MVKLKPETHSQLQEIAREDHKSMGEVITYLVDRYQRERFWRGAEQDLARLKEDQAAWNSYQSDLDEWDAAVADGLDSLPDADR